MQNLTWWSDNTTFFRKEIRMVSDNFVCYRTSARLQNFRTSNHCELHYVQKPWKHTLHLTGTQNNPQKQHIVPFAASRWFGRAGIADSKCWLGHTLENQGIVIRFAAGRTDLSLVHSIQTGSEAQSTSCLVGTETISPW